MNPSEPADVSDELPVQYQALDATPYLNTADARARGKVGYETYCTGCHGPEALGNGPFGEKLQAHTGEPERGSRRSRRPPSGGSGGSIRASWARPRVAHPTAMPAWRYILTDQQKWDIVYYARALVKAPEPKEK